MTSCLVYLFSKERITFVIHVHVFFLIFIIVELVVYDLFEHDYANQLNLHVNIFIWLI